MKVRGFRIELGEIEAALETHPAVRKVVALAREDSPGNKRLVAYLVPESATEINISGLRQFLQRTLPDYMIPAHFILLDSLPLSPNGKVDRKALPAPDAARPEIEAEFVAPHAGKEVILAEIWARLLGLEQVGIHDNFFELGGDSILSIQVIARANQASLRLTPKQLFQYPTIAELAAVAGSGPVIEDEQGIVKGPVPLTPIQHWFFEQDLPEPHHWNQAVMLEVAEKLDTGVLETAVTHLLSHHDALRLRFHRDKSGWRQTNAELSGETPVSVIDLSHLPESEQTIVRQAKSAALQASLNLGEGPLLRAAYFITAAGQPDYLLFVIHHLAIDGISWRILLEDLQLIYSQLSQGQPVQLPPKTTSFRHWAERLNKYARSDAIRAEAAVWQIRPDAAPLPLDFPGGAAQNSEESACRVTIALDQAETQALLQDVPPVYGTEINDVLLTAVTQAITQWTGSSSLLLHLEGHGREDILEGVDLSRTVGWFTAMYPVQLDLARAAEPGPALKAIKEQLRQIPNRGIGYGLLRYLGQDEAIAHSLHALPHPAISFNYLGQFDAQVDDSLIFAPSSASVGAPRSPQGRRSHLLDVNGGIIGGRLQFEWTYSAHCHRQATIEKVAEDFRDALRRLITHCQEAQTVSYTPSDFPDVALDEDEITALLEEIS